MLALIYAVEAYSKLLFTSFPERFEANVLVSHLSSLSTAMQNEWHQIGD